jgi:hypothetical protein
VNPARQSSATTPRNTQKPWREDRQRYQTGYPQALFVAREDQDRHGRSAR